MTKVIKIDDMEIEFEKQNPESSCKWCVYIRVRKKDNDHLLFMFKTNHKPYTKFTYNAGNTVANSSKTLKDILGNTMDSIEDLRNLEKDLKGEK